MGTDRRKKQHKKYKVTAGPGLEGNSFLNVLMANVRWTKERNKKKITKSINLSVSHIFLIRFIFLLLIWFVPK